MMPIHKFDVASSPSHAGRGTIRSMPMHFSRNANTGAAHVSFPLALTTARALTPALALNYHSNQGNSVFGMGFDLSGVLNITRSAHQGGVPKYDDQTDRSDIFILSSVGELVKVEEKNDIVIYRPRLDTQFAIIEYHVAEQCWLIKEANGVNHQLGGRDDSQVSHESRGIYQWWVNETYDAHGNKIVYNYIKKSTNNAVSFFLKSINYGNYLKNNDERFAFSCFFDYGDQDALEKNAKKEPLWINSSESRPDQFTHYRAGFGIATTERCQRILLYHALEDKNYLVKYWALEYLVCPENMPLSLMTSIQEIGCRSNSKNEYITQALSPATFDFFVLDKTASSMQPFGLEKDVKFPGLAGTYQWVDLYRDGLPGILYSDEFTTWYWRSEGKGKFSPPKRVTPFPHDMDFGSSSCRVMHLGNEKKTAFVVAMGEQAGYYLLDEEQLNLTDDQYTLAFSPHQPFKRYPIAFTQSINEVMDLNGTGKSDLLVLNAMFPHYYPASDTVEGGYEQPQLIQIPEDFPRNALDANALVTFVDIFGDGLLHRVKVSQDGIDIWPNLGYGRFAEKTRWDLPNIQGKFDPACVFLTDVDGSGACDFVYATNTELLVFLNQGQGFSSIQSHTLTLPEGYTHYDQLLFGDFLGTSVNGVIFIKKDINENRYYSGSFATQKPYLLCEIKSSSGIKTTFNYDTSITSYIKDRSIEEKNNNNLASIRLPFALPVLSGMIVQDPITQVTIEKTYQYHYGEYDFLERQFCGFAYVEATRHEYIDNPELKSTTDNHSEPIQKAVTKSWFYNRAIKSALNAFPRHDVLSLTNPDIGQHYYKENESTEGILLTNNLSHNLNLNREIHFSLHGYALGHETWGEGSDYFGEKFIALKPLCVQIEQYNVRCDKIPESQNQHGIFVIQPREHYRFVYEQLDDEPRVSREVNVKFDDKNRVLINVKIDYGRSVPIAENLIDNIIIDAATIGKLKDLQNTTHALCHQITYANVTSTRDFQYLNLIAEQKTFDLSGSALSTQTFSDIKTLAQNPPQTQLIQHHQQYYWDETQTTVEPLGSSGSLALTHHQCSLLGTHEQVQAWYPKLLKTTELETIESMLTENGYLSDKDEHDQPTCWWQPDVIQHYGDATQYYQLIEVKHMNEYETLNQPSLFQRTTILRDQYQLAVIEVNQYLTAEKAFAAKFETDYQSMKPCQVIDHNHNTHLILYNSLRQVMATTKYGQLQGEWIGNPVTEDPSLAISATQLSDLSFMMSQRFENTTLENICENSAVLLGPWLAVYYYHYMSNLSQPRYSVALTQSYYQKRALPILTETPKTPIGISIQYVDGFDHPLQIKQRTDETDANKHWLGSGITIHSRTGKTLRQSLPNFSATAQCDSISMVMDSAKSLANEYDAAGELLRQTLPNGDQRQLRRTPWYEVYYDQNVMHNKRHENKVCSASTIIYFKDAADNPMGHLKIAFGESSSSLFTHTIYDVLARPIIHQDARLPVPNLTITYDLIGQAVSHHSVDRGEEIFLHNHQGTRTRRHIGDWSHQTELDSWQRPLTLNVYSDTQTPVAIETWQYGEMLNNPESLNACGEVVQFANEESIFRQEIFNLDGYCIQSQRMIRLPAMTANIQKTLENNEATRAFFDGTMVTDWQKETFEFKREYDVFGNLLAECLPDGRRVVKSYNALLQLQKIQSGTTLDNLFTVADMTYQEAGFLTTRQFGNNVISNYNYDRQTQRLTGIISKNQTMNILQDHVYSFDPVGNITQLKLGELKLLLKKNVISTFAENSLNYTYDDYYRLTTAQGLQLTEKKIVSDARVIPQQLFSDETSLAIERFTQTFRYDNGDNLISIQHFNTNELPNNNIPPAWQLGFDIQEQSNQFATLTSTVDNEKVELADGKSLYDAAGNMQKLDATTDLNWDHTNQLRQVATKISDLAIAGSKETSVKEHYAYRGTAFQAVSFATAQGNQAMMPYTPKFFGQAATSIINTKPFAEYANRLYKISCFEKADKSIEVIEQVFLGNYERKRIFNIASGAEITPNPTFIRHSLQFRDEDNVFASHHVFECDQNALEVSQSIPLGTSPLEQWEYHLTDHLHSSLLDVDDQGKILCIEAYQPYGQIAFIQTRDTKQLSRKDYHYSSQMRDHISGLYYYGARYYAPQFGRWLSPDPAGLIEGLNLYGFVKNNPMSFWDDWGYSKKRHHSAINSSDSTSSSSGAKVNRQVEALRNSVGGLGNLPYLNNEDRPGHTTEPGKLRESGGGGGKPSVSAELQKRVGINEENSPLHKKLRQTIMEFHEHTQHFPQRPGLTTNRMSALAYDTISKAGPKDTFSLDKCHTLADSAIRLLLCGIVKNGASAASSRGEKLIEFYEYFDETKGEADEFINAVNDAVDTYNKNQTTSALNYAIQDLYKPYVTLSTSQANLRFGFSPNNQFVIGGGPLDPPMISVSELAPNVEAFQKTGNEVIEKFKLKKHVEAVEGVFLPLVDSQGRPFSSDKHCPSLDDHNRQPSNLNNLPPSIFNSHKIMSLQVTRKDYKKSGCVISDQLLI